MARRKNDGATSPAAATPERSFTPWLWANRQIKFKPVTANQVTKMLMDAGANKPWKAPELCDHIAKALTILKQFVEPNRVAEQTVEHRAWEKQKALLKELPALRAQWQFDYKSQYGPDAEQANAIDLYRNEQLEKLNAIEAALKAYFVAQPAAGDTIEGSWHEHAIKLWTLYVMLVGEGSTSKNGPAVRFVSSALLVSGWSERQRRTGRRAIVPPNPASIEQALTRGGCQTVKRGHPTAKRAKDHKAT